MRDLNLKIMKKILLTLFAITPIVLFAQNPIEKIPFNDSKIEFEKILEVDGKTANELYSQTKLIITELYKSGKSVIDSYDDDALNIVVKGITYYPLKDWLGTINQKLEHTLIFQFKDGRVRIRFTDLIVSTVPAENIIKDYRKNKYSNKIREAHAQGILNAWNDIIETLESKYQKNTDAW